MIELINVIVENGVTIGVVCYFAFVNYQFMQRIDSTLTAINELLHNSKD